MINYYEILEVSEKASDEIIEKAYKVLAKKYHPDLQQGKDKKIAEEKMKIINEAYEILSNKEKRESYDSKLSDEREKLQREKESKKVENSYERQNYSKEAKEQEYNKNYAEQNYRKSHANSNNFERNRYNEAQEMYNNEYYEEIKRQREYRERLEREERRRYAQAYENYLRSLGYKIKYKWTWERVKALLMTILAFVIIGVVLWINPPSREYMIQLYEENFIVKMIVDIVISLINSIIDIFRN